MVPLSQGRPPGKWEDWFPAGLACEWQCAACHVFYPLPGSASVVLGEMCPSIMKQGLLEERRVPGFFSEHVKFQIPVPKIFPRATGLMCHLDMVQFFWVTSALWVNQPM